MVKTPRTRHSKTQREPITIDLDPADVTREEAAVRSSPERAAAEGDSFTAAELGGEHGSEAEARVEAETSPQAGLDGAAQTEAELIAADGGLAGDEARPAASDPSALAPESTSDADASASMETGTAPQPEQEYRAGESVQEPPGYAFEEAKPAGKERASSHTAMPSPARPHRDGFSRIAAGVIGAAIALAAAGALQYAGVLGSPGGAAPVASVPDADIENLRQEIAALRAAAGDPAAVNDLNGRIEALSGEVAAVKQALASVEGGTGGADPAALQAVDGRVRKLEDALAALQGRDAPDNADLAALGDRIVGLQAEVRTAVEGAAATDERIGTLEESVRSLAARVDAQAQQPKIALAISTAALRSAVDRGAPFGAELETFAAIAPGAPEIDALRPYAEKGVPTRDDLLEEIEPASAAMIASANPVDPNAGFFDRLLNSAESLVTVRPIGDVAGEGVGEVLARLEVALRAGDLDKALAEFDSLPDPVKAAGGDFGQRLKARRDVEKLVEQAIAGAMKA